jgi:hypothetical protein
MNLLEFHDKLSSTSDQKVNNASEDAVIFALLNGSFHITDIEDISINNGKYFVQFISDELVVTAEGKFNEQLIPGVYNRPLYRVNCSKNGERSLAIKLVSI